AIPLGVAIGIALKRMPPAVARARVMLLVGTLVAIAIAGILFAPATPLWPRQSLVQRYAIGATAFFLALCWTGRVPAALAAVLPQIFSPTSYATKPPVFQHIQDKVVAARGLHVVTPEYNGSFPGILKYFIDMLKFPESFERKPVAFVGEAAGIWGGFRSVEQLEMIFGYRNAYLFPDRIFIPGISQKFDADGKFLDAAIDERLAKQAVG